MSTIKDVANMAGVSITTVSRIISGDTQVRVTEETRSRVWDSALKLNYWPRPSSKHRTMSTAADTVLACVFSLTLEKYSDPFFVDILAGAESRLMKENMHFAITRTYNDLMDPSILTATFNRPIKGLLLLEEIPEELLHYIMRCVPHIVGVDTFYSGIDNVGFDRKNAAIQSVGHLLERGRKRIGFIGGSGIDRPLSESRRYDGYAHCLQKAGIEIDPNLVKNCQWRQELAQECMRELLALEQPPDAVFCSSDLIAIAALSVIYERGLKVPAEISIVGVHNNEITGFTSPPLTTIDVHARDIGYTAADILLARLNGDKSIHKSILLQSELVVRDST